MLFLGLNSWSQDLVFLFKGVVENSDLGKRQAGVKVEIIQNGSVLHSATTASNGKYTLRGPIDYLKPFKVVFSKSGLVSKMVYFDFSRMNEEDIPAGDSYQPVERLDMTLFKERENVDFSFLKTEPVASFDWNTRQMNPRLDAVAMNAMKTRILKLLSDAEAQKKQAQINYQKAISEADNFFNTKEYEKSLAKYEEALSYIPTEQYPIDRIDELDALILAQKQAELADKQENEAYYNLIEAADNLRDQGQLEKAVDKYEEALELKNEQYPQDQVDKLLDEIERIAKEKKYDEAIQRGDAFMKQNSLRAAKDMYTEASKLRPKEQYPKDKLAEIEGLLKAVAEQEALKKKYDEAIAAADDFFSKDDFVQAKAKYEEAVAIESSSTYAKGRIDICNIAIEKAKAEEEKQAKILKLLSEAEAFMSKKEWRNAIDSYEKVLSLDENNSIAKAKIQIAEEELSRENALVEQEESYKALVKEGDLYIQGNDFDNALEKYKEAKNVKDTPEIQTKISETKDKIEELARIAAEEAEKKAKQQEYEAIIKEADLDFGNKKWELAKGNYQKALGILPNEDYPSRRISEIDEKIAQELAEKKKEEEEKAKNEKYNSLITEADALFESEDWENAKSKYREALEVDPIKTYPTERINLIDIKISEELAAKKKEEEEKNKREKYKTMIDLADASFNAKEWTKAKEKYQEAQLIDETQTYPSEQIALIEKNIQEELSQQQEELAEKEREEKYQSLIAEANMMFEARDWEPAIKKYQEAIKVDASKSYPSEQISKINDLVREEQEKQKEEQLAKEKEEKYNSAIAKADDLYSQEKWEDAIKKYQEALLIDGTKSYPSERIALSEEKLNAIQSQAEKAAAEAKKQANIQQKISEGEKLFSQERWDDAKNKFEEVLILDNNNQIAIDKINEINIQIAAIRSQEEENARFESLKEQGLLSMKQGRLNEAKDRFNRALEIKSDSFINQKIIEIDQLLAAETNAKNEESKYKSLLDQASKKEIAHDYVGAIELLNQASSLRPDEAFPKKRAADLAELLKKEKEAKTVNEKYAQAIAKGDDLMSHKDYLGAIREYNKAIALKPDEKEPVDKAAEAERLEKSKNSDEDSQYEKIITVAQKKINGAEYDRAIELLKRAQSLRPGDDRPKQMLELIALIKEKERKYISLMEKGDELASRNDFQAAINEFKAAKLMQPTATEPDERILEMEKKLAESQSARQKEELYLEYMSKGSSFKKKELYEQALAQYSNALNVKPGDVDAQNRIDEINQILKDLASNEAEDLLKKNKFNAIVGEADELFGNANYLSAKSKYEEALMIYPNNSYVKLQIEECVRQEKLISIQQAEREYQKIIKAADKYFDLEDYNKSKGYYERAVSVRMNDPYPKKRLAEINAILNPVQVESTELQDLGDPFDNSIMDGSFILAQAEEQRKALKKIKIQEKQNLIHTSEEAAFTEKTKQHYEVSNDIYEVYRGISVESGEKELSQYELDEALRKAKLEVDRQAQEDKTMEHGENVTDQTVLNTITKESALEYGEKEEVYQENTDILTTYNRNHERANIEDVLNDYDANLQVNNKISKKKESFDDGFKEQYDRRIEVANEVGDIHKKADDAHAQASQDRAEKVVGNQEELDDIQIAAEKKASEQTAYAQDNNNVLKKSQEELAKAHENENIEEVNKYRGNKQIINEKVKQTSEVDEKAKEAHVKKVEYVNEMDKKAQANNVDAIEGDYEERLDAKKKIDKIHIEHETKTDKELKKIEENNSAIADTKKTQQANDENRSIGEQEKHYDVQSKLNKIEETPMEAVKVKNSLGEEYPEGVSQETFTKSDADGLVTTFITRRIVVIDGHADVYVRTQTAHGTTYTKNGKPSLQSVWNKETQGPHLERHF